MAHFTPEDWLAILRALLRFCSRTRTFLSGHSLTFCCNYVPTLFFRFRSTFNFRLCSTMRFARFSFKSCASLFRYLWWGNNRKLFSNGHEVSWVKFTNLPTLGLRNILAIFYGLFFAFLMWNCHANLFVLIFAFFLAKILAIRFHCHSTFFSYNRIALLIHLFSWHKSRNNDVNDNSIVFLILWFRSST